jgi:hypothetical protein
MHPALQTAAHLPQEVHTLLSRWILKYESLENNPSNIPTGHKLLQKSLPNLSDNTVTERKTNIEKATEIQWVTPGSTR